MTAKEISLLTNYSDVRAAEHIYYNTIYTNNTGSVAPIIINDRRASMLIDEGLKYRYTGTVKRFLIDSFLIPLTYINDPASFVVSICFGPNLVASSSLVFTPSSNSNQASLMNGIFSVEQWVKCLNDTLTAVYDAALISPSANPLPASFAPFFFYDGERLSLVANTTDYYPANPAGWSIKVSNAIFIRLGGNMNYEYSVGASPLDATLLIKSLGNNLKPNAFYCDFGTPPVVLGFTTLTMPISDNAIVSLSTINQILIQAVSTEVRPQYYGSNLLTSTPPNLSLQTLEDFIYIPSGRGKILYQPTIERPFNMISDKPITQFSFNVMYIDSDLQTYNALCIPGSVSSFKFGFTKSYAEDSISMLMSIYKLVEKCAKSLKLI